MEGGLISESILLQKAAIKTIHIMLSYHYRTWRYSSV